MTKLLRLIAGLSLVAAGSCSDPTNPPPPNVTLSTAQAANLKAKATTMSGVHADLAWLADSIEVILKAGTIAVNIPITVDGQVKRYYAVSLVRQIIGDSTSISTLHFIAFDDVSAPTDFILVNAYAQVPGTTPIGDIAAPLGAPTMFAHKVHIDGATVTDYVGKTGSVDFSVIYGNIGCGSSFGITCTTAFLDSDFTITLARPDATPSDTHTFSVDDVAVPGFWLLFNNPS